MRVNVNRLGLEDSDDFWKLRFEQERAKCERLERRMAEITDNSGPGEMVIDSLSDCLAILKPLDVVGEPNTLRALTAKAMRRLTEAEAERDRSQIVIADINVRLAGIREIQRETSATLSELNAKLLRRG